VRPQLLHLSGPLRGRTLSYDSPKLVFGTSDDCDIRYPEGSHVARRHAALEFVEDGCSFYLKALEGQVLVNRQEIREVILENGDLLEIGVGGPKLRFRIDYSDGKPCKAVRTMLRDVREVRSESGFLAGSKALRHDFFTQISRRARIVILVVMLAAVFAAAHLGGIIGSARTARQHVALREQQAEQYEKDLAKIREQMEEFQRRQAGNASRDEVDRLRADLASRAHVVDELVQRNIALRKVLEVYTRGVCLLHGRYTFKVRQDDAMVPVVDADGDPLEVEYLGSGFLASSEGHVITNRHVAEPWWNNAAVAPLLEQGLVPEFVQLTATFPGKQPLVVDLQNIELSPDNVDVAVLQVPVEDAPVLPLRAEEIDSLRGSRVVVLGYPTGLNAILARADPDLVSEVLANATDTTSLIAELATRNVVWPVITQGALNEVRPNKLIYDAETTSGGSGGPVFGRDGTVIGVNFAITYDFDGSNFGVPISFARAMVPVETAPP